MRNFLLFLAILVVTIPVLLILQPLFGWNLVSKEEYFFLVVVFVGLYLLYKKDKASGKKKS